MLDEEQFARLAEQSKVEGRSVGSMIREAIDLVWPSQGADRQRAADIILAASAMPVPDALSEELDAVRADRFR